MIGYEEGRCTLRLTRMIYRFSDIAAVRLALIVFFVCLLNSHIPGQVESKPRDEQSETVQTNIPSLKESLSEYFPVGAAIRLADITGPHGELLKRHFNRFQQHTASGAYDTGVTFRANLPLDCRLADDQLHRDTML